MHLTLACTMLSSFIDWTLVGAALRAPWPRASHMHSVFRERTTTASERAVVRVENALSMSIPSVAHCIVGQARGFTQRAVWRSILSNVVDAFGGRADIFLALKYGDQREHDELAAHSAPWRNYLQPVAVSLRDSAAADRDSTLRVRSQCRGVGAAGLELQAAIVSLDGLHCLQLVAEEEQQRGGRYDIVTKLRPDEQVCVPWPSWHHFDWRGRLYSSSIATYLRGGRTGCMHDHVAIMARPLADAYFGAYRLLNNYTSLTECVDERNSFHRFVPYPYHRDLGSVLPECLLTRWLQMNAVGFDNGKLLGPGGACLWDGRWGRDGQFARRAAERPRWCAGVGTDPKALVCVATPPQPSPPPSPPQPHWMRLHDVAQRTRPTRTRSDIVRAYSVPPPYRVAVLYHGHYYRAHVHGETTYRGPKGTYALCSDYFQAASNHEAHLLRPLRDHFGVGRVAVLLHTFESGCRRRDRQLLAALNPVAHEIVPHDPTRRIVDSYLAVLRMLSASSDIATDAFVVLMRFDLVIRWFPQLDPDRINFAFRAELKSWELYHSTSDLFFALPRRFVDSLYDALNISIGAGHWTYDPLVRDPRVGVSSIRFIEPGHYQSTQDVRHVRGIPMDSGVFLAILRACPERPFCAEGGGSRTEARPAGSSSDFDAG